MIIHRKGICSGCGEEKYIQNKTKNLCKECVYLRNHNNVAYKPKPIKSKKTYRYKYKVTGERDLFKEIWEEREHICVNCKAYLGEEPLTFFFAHVKAKGADGTKRLLKKNIKLHCWDCHDALDKQGIDAYKKRFRRRRPENS